MAAGEGLLHFLPGLVLQRLWSKPPKLWWCVDRGGCRPFRASGCEVDPGIVEVSQSPSAAKWWTFLVSNRDRLPLRQYGASGSVHRQSGGHSSCLFETGTNSANCVENRGIPASGSRPCDHAASTTTTTHHHTPQQHNNNNNHNHHTPWPFWGRGRERRRSGRRRRGSRTSTWTSSRRPGRASSLPRSVRRLLLRVELPRGRGRRGRSASFLALLFLVLDVSVLFNNKFQQSNSYMFSKVPQLQFIVRLRTFLLCNRDGYSQWKLCRKSRRFHKCSSMVDVAVIMQRQVGALVPRAVEVPQTQFIDRVLWRWGRRWRWLWIFTAKKCFSDSVLLQAESQWR